MNKKEFNEIWNEMVPKNEFTSAEDEFDSRLVESCPAHLVKALSDAEDSGKVLAIEWCI